MKIIIKVLFVVLIFLLSLFESCNGKSWARIKDDVFFKMLFIGVNRNKGLNETNLEQCDYVPITLQTCAISSEHYIPIDITCEPDEFLREDGNQGVSVCAEKDRIIFQKIQMRGDGNCFFRALSYHLKYTDNEYKLKRAEVVTYLENQWDNVIGLFNGDVDKTEHLEEMRKDGEFATQFELTAASLLYEKSIYVYEVVPSTNYSKWDLFKNFFNLYSELKLTKYYSKFVKPGENLYLLLTGHYDAAHFDILEKEFF